MEHARNARAGKARRLGTRSVPIALAAACSLVLALEGARFQRQHSVTFDETAYLSLALQSIHDGTLDARTALSGVAPLPWLVAYVPPLFFAPRQERPKLFGGQVGDAALLAWPRVLSLWAFGIPTVLVVFAMLRGRAGLTAAVLGAGLLVLSPTMIAQASLATADCALALGALAGLAGVAWYLRAPGTTRLMLAALGVAAAMSAKYSGIAVLVAACGGLVLAGLADRANRVRAVVRAAGRCLMLTSAAAFVWWGAHLFRAFGAGDAPSLRALFGDGPLGQGVVTLARHAIAPFPLVGVAYQVLHDRRGQEAFLLGARSTHGWPAYFPLAFAFKSTPVELALAAVLVWRALAALRSPVDRLLRLDPVARMSLIFLAVYLSMLMLGHLDLGQRYLLPVYPVMIVLVVPWIVRACRDRRRVLWLAVGGLLAAQAVSAASIGAADLAYFNAFAGGAANGWRLLADSSVDWGQDLPALRGVLSRLGAQPVALSYFGTARLEDYGVQADRVGHLTRPLEQYAAIAISVTHLDGVDTAGADDPFREFRALTPWARAGYSILVYDLRDPTAEQALRDAVERMGEAASR